MARTNKYTSINFNHIYDKTATATTTASSPSKHPQPSISSSSYSAVSRTHGRMLVLSRPSPKPVTAPIAVSTPQPQPLPQPQPRQVPDQVRSEPAPDSISLRPLGRTGIAPLLAPPVPAQERDKEVVAGFGGGASTSPKPNKFVPPHLRPGFVGKEERPGLEVFRGREQPGQRNFGSPGGYGEEGGRPKSGGGYERMRRGGESDLGVVSRPRSSGNRPNSSGNRPNSSGWWC